MSQPIEGKLFPILILDDEDNIRLGLKSYFEIEKYSVEDFASGHLAYERCLHQEFSVAIVDLSMPSMRGEEFVDKILTIQPHISLIILTGHGTIEKAVELVKKGVFDFCIKPIEMAHLCQIVEKAEKQFLLKKENSTLKKILSQYQNQEKKGSFAELVARMPSLKEKLWNKIPQIAQSMYPVLIEGETGTGKRWVAQAIHEMSGRKGECIEINCAALSDSLLESELFGHEKGAFTGAIAMKKGKFELAHQGTLFLDEIGDISPRMQVLLLKVLEEQVFQRVGGEKNIQVDVRIITATNQSLKHLISQGKFREDLYYRLNVISLTIPPLREHPEDIEFLAEAMLKDLSSGKPMKSFSPEAKKALSTYPFQGNIRELRHILENILVFSTKDIIAPEDIPFSFFDKEQSDHSPISSSSLEGESREEAESKEFFWTIQEPKTLHELEYDYILRLLEYYQGNKMQVAKKLGISRKTLYSKLGHGESTDSSSP